MPLLPLKWKDINFESKSITVSTAMAAQVKFDKNGNVLERGYYINAASNKKEINLTDDIVIILNEYKRIPRA